MTQNSNDPHQARDALEDAEAHSRSAAARLPENDSWYELIWLACIGGLVITPVLPMPFNLLAVFALVFALSKMMSSYQERYGVWVSGYRRGRTRIIAISLSVLLFAIMISVWIIRLRLGLIWPAFAGAAIAVLISFILSRAWMRAYRRDTSGS
ncbi:hypothetical protein IC757_09800 [Wenzhouxiangella sp. AB-CW3]|uniref:hypothetical protein n=1 Tax=Wenzhouxiangella sp. AB-CW3 TaxID=2771012 RepID=UPI00168A450B|nr:hypothetical protein [Wenzhouxiangella sp. AB-CW3]QOC21348.1 hypothetical protein IC757_09800 [Wenzhouxiangella sp. AB-CW3]